jgi:DtxR family Mn-dependent transcriptional regulator
VTAGLVTLALAAGAAVAAALLRPGVGLLPRWRRARRLASRVLVEDALKHIQEAEYRGLPATLQSVAGALAISLSEATAVAARMEARGLVRTVGEGLGPTPAGREYALQVIRAHRLWERYLADETGVAEGAWHLKAERREHGLTRVQADELAARLGHPRFDPHGDPIPTARGEMPASGPGVPLSEVAAGRDVRVVHIEDEPPDAYVRLADAGLHVGTRIRTVEVGGDALRFRADGEEVLLPRVLATGVTVVESSDTPDDAHAPTGRLSELRPGESGEIVAISRACRGLERRRLMDLGIVPGTPVQAVMRSPSGDPTAYRIRGTTIAIRRRQADRIRIRRPAAAREEKQA